MGHINRLAALAAVLLVIGAVSAVLSLGSPSPSNDATLLEPPAGPSAADQRIAALQTVAGGPQASPGALVELGYLYLQKARETADPAYYARAEEAFQRVLSSEPPNPLALIGAASVSLARHDFKGALVLATQATHADPESPDAHGVLFDSLVELGRYDEAVDALQRMADLRPDANSYARISYARELHGDLSGAREAMTLAVQAAGPKGETAAWLRLQLGHLYFAEGDVARAEDLYQSSLEAYPGYIHGIAALGRSAAADKDYAGAAELYEKATERLPVLEYVVTLGDVYAAAGDDEAARRQHELVGAIDGLLKASGVKTDMELALYYADHGDPQKAVDLARGAYADRPSVQGADALAWTLFRAGMTDEALAYSREAMRLGWRDPIALFRAGMVEAAADNPATAREYLNALDWKNSVFSPLYAGEAAQALGRLESLAGR